MKYTFSLDRLFTKAHWRFLPEGLHVSVVANRLNVIEDDLWTMEHSLDVNLFHASRIAKRSSTDSNLTNETREIIKTNFNTNLFFTKSTVNNKIKLTLKSVKLNS